jgi:hypothetical protein|tara:strand:- start:1954 stop:2970 length:1017 start_codon:yes stop_codon:yes gene_type:complete
MSTNIGELVDRVYREYLEPMDDLTSYTVLNEGSELSASDTVITFNGDLLTQEEEDAMDAGTIIECEKELMRCVALDTVNNQVTVVRGVRGTTATTHADGSVLKIAPPFPRQVVFDAVKDQINNLFPTLFAVDTQSITTSTGYTLIGSYDAPGTHNYLVSILSAISQYTDFSAGSDTTGVVFAPVTSSLVELPNPFTYTDSDGVSRTITYSSGPSVVHAIQFSGIASGHTAHVTFKKKFIEPTAESDTLATVGLEQEYEPIIMAGVAAQLLSGRDIPTATADYISDQLSVSAFPVGSASSIRNSLLQYQQLLINQARKHLRAKYPEAVSVDGKVFGIQA